MRTAEETAIQDGSIRGLDFVFVWFGFCKTQRSTNELEILKPSNDLEWLSTNPP